jgi:RNA polymerase sigma-70 factor (ECF subfamily)
MKRRTVDFLPLLLGSQPKIRAFIFTLIPRWDDADEIYQETSLVLWEKFDEYEAGTDFCSWACSVARNKVMNLRSRRAVASRIFSDQCVESIAAEHRDHPNWDARREALAGCLKKLRPHDRELLDRCYQREATITRAAEELGRPLKAVHKALKRIRMALYSCVKKTIALEDR